MGLPKVLLSPNPPFPSIFTPRYMCLSRVRAHDRSRGHAAQLPRHAFGSAHTRPRICTTHALTHTRAQPLSDVRTHSTSTDVWAMGVTLYQMVYGILPFWSSTGAHTELESMITHRELSFPPSSRASSGALLRGFKDYGESTAASHTLVGPSGAAQRRRSDSMSSHPLEAHDPMVGYLKVRTFRWEGGGRVACV